MITFLLWTLFSAALIGMALLVLASWLVRGPRDFGLSDAIQRDDKIQAEFEQEKQAWRRAFADRHEKPRVE